MFMVVFGFALGVVSVSSFVNVQCSVFGCSVFGVLFGSEDVVFGFGSVSP